MRDHETLWHITVLSNLARGYDKYSRVYSKVNIPKSSYPDRFFLLREDDLVPGIRKAASLLERLALPGDRLLALQTRIPAAELRPNTRTGVGCFVERSGIRLDGVAWVEEDPLGRRLVPVAMVEAAAHSLRLLQPALQPWSDLQPRSFSVLPVARGCQAQCPFCFSDASASAEQGQRKLNFSSVQHFSKAARLKGAERFVITGGGEPGLVRHELLCQLIRAGHATLGKTVLITNGHHLARQSDAGRAETLRAYHEAGLSVLAISRHHHEDEISTRLMHLHTSVADIARTWKEGCHLRPGIRLRFTCVLQRGGVDTLEAMEAYVEWTIRLGVEEICFKELYVSTSVESVYHAHAANEWSSAHQIPLSLVLEFAARHGFSEEVRLPWGSPVFHGTWRGTPLRIAAYTEPSVFWERTHGVARSWNLMADGTCLASLEDRSSTIELPAAA